MIFGKKLSIHELAHRRFSIKDCVLMTVFSPGKV